MPERNNLYFIIDLRKAAKKLSVCIPYACARTELNYLVRITLYQNKFNVMDILFNAVKINSGNCLLYYVGLCIFYAFV